MDTFVETASATRNFTLNDLAWAAGFIDGEGRVIIGGKPGHYQLTLKVDNTVLAPATKLQKMFDGGITTRAADKNRKLQYIWQVSDAAAKRVLGLLYPFLTVKTRQAAIAAVYPVDRQIQRNSLKPFCSMNAKKR